jgi:hypothetical protein
MPYAVSLADLCSSGYVLVADEAVAIARKLIDHPSNAAPQPPFGPLAAARIRIASDGSVACVGCAATPTVAEVAILLQELLDRTPHVPGGLRYVIARALHDVDAPPFDSLEEFSAALARYSPANVDEAVQRLVARRDRRKAAQSASELRLHLREADRRLFEAQARPESSRRRRDTQTHGWIIAALFAGALTMIAAASVVGDRSAVMPPPPAAPPFVTADTPASVVESHPVLVAPTAHRARVAAKPVVHAARLHTIRLRWLHTTIAIKDDLGR